MGDKARVLRIWAIWAGIILLIFLVGRYLLRFLSPFIVAFILMSIIDSPVAFLERRLRLPRSLAVLLMLALLLLIFGFAVTLGISQLYAELVQLSRSLPLYERNITETLLDIIRELERFYRGLPPQVTELILSGRAKLYDWLQRILLGLTGLVTSLPGLVVVITVSFISAYFMSRDKDQILEFLFRLAPGTTRKRIEELKREVTSSVMGFIRAECILISLTTILTIMGFSLLGFGYAWVLGILAGILDLLPFVGISLIFVPMIGYHLFVGNIRLAIYILIVFVVVAMVRQLAEPKVIGVRIGLHPLATLLSIYVGIQALGAIGLVIGPLSVILLRALVNSGILPLFPDE